MSRRKRQKTGMINNEKENNSMTQEPQTPQQTVDEQQMVIPQESERIQRAEWIHEQVKLQREAEDEAWEKIMEEQKLLTERRRSIDADINSNRELKRYHEDCMEDITDQVYSLHGISVDKLEGIKEYRNALFRGEAFIVFCISVIMAAIVAYALRTDLTAVPVYTHVCRRGGSIVVPKAKEYTVFHTAYTDSGGDDWL
ncbi:MAG: hypothetical protein LKE32_01380 [Lachnospiraceae bacterium]|jgi:hypothetical protein|nr:hypothetical protein [Lachnospiraceae bacterium]